MRPPVIVSTIVAGAPPYSQSLSRRLGKPLPPPASEPWHGEQYVRNIRSPVCRAAASAAICSTSIFAYLSYSGARRASNSERSLAYAPEDVHPSTPGMLPSPGYRIR